MIEGVTAADVSWLNTLEGMKEGVRVHRLKCGNTATGVEAGPLAGRYAADVKQRHSIEPAIFGLKLEHVCYSAPPRHGLAMPNRHKLGIGGRA